MNIGMSIFLYVRLASQSRNCEHYAHSLQGIPEPTHRYFWYFLIGFPPSS
jgi:hypothetical protein